MSADQTLSFVLLVASVGTTGASALGAAVLGARSLHRRWSSTADADPGACPAETSFVSLDFDDEPTFPELPRFEDDGAGQTAEL